MFRRRTLRDVATYISRGVSPRYDESGFVVINQRCIRGHRIQFEAARITSGSTRIRPEKFVHPWDVLVNSTGVGTLGRVAQAIGISDDVTVDSHVTIVRPDLTMLDGRYFGYALRFREPYIETLGVGATGQTELARKRLSELEIPVPPLPSQRKVAAVLSAYDDLLENNLRRIEILEEMAIALFKQWFVQFRFPGKEKVGLVDSPIGTIPDGWRICTLGEFIDLNKGLSYKGAYLTEEGLPMVNLKCINRGGGFRRDGTKPYSGDYKDRHVVRPGHIVLANTDLTQAGLVIGSPAIVPRQLSGQDILISHHLYAVRLKDESQILPFFLYHLFLADDFKNFARGRASGTTVLGLRPDDVLAYEFPCPPDKIMLEFESFARNLHEMIEVLEEENGTLAQTLELLIPKLVSGVLDVSNLDIDTEVLDT